MAAVEPLSRSFLLVRRRLYALTSSFLLAATCAQAAPSVDLVFGDPAAPAALRISAGGAEPIALPDKAPLGSLWKLFVHVYLSDSGRREADYRCTGRLPSEEVYCCAPGETIGRDAALARSCGLYFAPARLGLSATDWRAYWSREVPQAPTWLLDLKQLQPATEVSVSSLLSVLDAIDEEKRRPTEAALQRVTLEARGRPLLNHLGNSLRVKTWSWRDENGRRVGGFAGWLTDGTPVWLRGNGTSAQVIEEAAPWLADRLPASQPPDEACVKVRFFRRYPLATVLLDGKPASEGSLKGKVEACFANGQRLSFNANGDISLRREGGSPRLDGRFALNDYVARVVQREASTEPTAAARALAVAARTYLVRHAEMAGGCYMIDDDSRTQRVSPAPPTGTAMSVARWSDSLVLSGVDGRYHLKQEAPRQMSWQGAVAAAEAGRRWDEILVGAYGDAGFSLAGEGDAGECHPLPVAENWLAARQKNWRQRLAAIPGFEAPAPLPRVCRLEHGQPYADIGRGRIYATGSGNVNERLTLAHEYLHFALANHPRGRDEDFVEQTARSLLGTP